MRKRLRWAALAAIVAAAVAAGVLAHLWTAGPLYHIGDVRDGARLAEPLSVPAQTHPGYFDVAPGVRLRWFAEGAGDDVLVVHGGPGMPPERPWRGATLVGTTKRFVYYHQRGSGESTRPIERFAHPDRVWENAQELHVRLGIPAQVADIERIRQILGHEKLVLVGHSFGGLIATLYAAEFPSRVRRLLLLVPADYIQVPSPRDDLFTLIGGRLPASAAAQYGDWRRDLFDLGRVLERDDQALAGHYSRIVDFFRLAGGQAPPASGTARPGGWMPVGFFLGIEQRHDFRDALKHVQAPVLVVHGAGDLVPVAASEAFARYFPNGQLVVVRGAGHFVFDEAPAEFAQIAREFL